MRTEFLAGTACAAARLEAEVAWRRNQNMMGAWAREKTPENLAAHVEARAESELANERYKAAKSELDAARAEYLAEMLAKRGAP